MAIALAAMTLAALVTARPSPSGPVTSWSGDELGITTAWALAVLESGRTMIELRQELATGSNIEPAVRDAATGAMHAIARLYHEPDAARWHAADAAVHAAIAAAAEQKVRLHLYQLRSALRDDESPFAAYITPPSPESVHAA